MNDYKKYSLGKLEEWVHDAISCSEATPQEIYDVIKNTVSEEYYSYENYASRCYELLTLLNGCDKDDKSSERQNSFWEENYYPEEYKKHNEKVKDDCMPPWGHSDMEALRYTEEELNAMCDKAASDEEKEKCREYNLREAEYYNKKHELNTTYQQAIDDGWTMTGDGFWIKERIDK